MLLPAVSKPVFSRRQQERGAAGLLFEFAYLCVADPRLAERRVLLHQLLESHPGLVVLFLPAELQGTPAAAWDEVRQQRWWGLTTTWRQLRGSLCGVPAAGPGSSITHSYMSC
jgi:hypothetical protein